MTPLVLDGGAPEVVFWILLSAWLLGEGAFALQTTMRNPETRDPSEPVLTAALVGGIGLGILVAATVESLALPGPRWWPPLAGLCVFAFGIVFRVWAVRTLGRFFRYTIVVDEDHRVVEDGPYRLIRHPSYTGLLLAALGVGLALGNWLAIAACLIPPLIGFSIRLLHEERVLAAQLGDPYRAYMQRTRRLVPGLW
ncbi:MAG TPA: isoprenylcysteine carboxylmethyltransferase family protein [Solirubrobacterales bacterium]|nr:isoprenylcysteine carboxylmethyltransferase family protein [Solirubrobacterales bacterium]